LHALREFLFFANKGKIRRKQEEEQAHQATCLNLLVNEIIIPRRRPFFRLDAVWNDSLTCGDQHIPANALLSRLVRLLRPRSPSLETIAGHPLREILAASQAETDSQPA
jgi:hypothetical protein